MKHFLRKDGQICDPERAQALHSGSLDSNLTLISLLSEEQLILQT